MFGRKKFIAPAGLSTNKRKLEKSVPFVFDSAGKPAVSLSKEPAGGGRVSLLKGYEAASNALVGVDLAGLRMRIIVILDGSGSMSSDYANGNVQKLLVRALGFALNVSQTGTIEVYVYGYGVSSKPVVVTRDNYQDIARLIRPDYGSTAMTEAMAAALQLAKKSDILTMILNLTDGNPNNKGTMSNVVVDSASYPVILKNLSLRPVSYLEEIDDLPSQYEIKKGAGDKPVYDGQGNLIIERNPDGIRLVDNVDSKGIDPSRATDREFAEAMADEIAAYLEVAARVGLLTGVPGHTREF